MSDSSASGREHWRPVAWLWWAVTGAAIGLGSVGLLTVGVLFLGLGLATAVAGAAKMCGSAPRPPSPLE